MLLLLAAGCAQDSAPAAASLALSAGKEASTWDEAPVPAKVTLLKIQGEQRATLVETAWPAASLDLGELEPGSRWAFRAEFRDAGGALVMAGQTPELASDALSGGEVLLHCGRVGAFSRPSNGLGAGWLAPRVGALGRYVLVAGEATGGAATSELYDLALLAPLQSQSALPRSPRSLAVSSAGVALLVDEQGASSLDLGSGTASEITVAQASEASGGRTVRDDQGGSYIVGPTRTAGDPSAVVLKLDASGVVSRIDLGQPRRAAAAAWVAGVGLVIAGGEEQGPVEVVAPGASAPVALGLSLAPAAHATLVELGQGEAALIGGTAGAVALRLSLACASGCPSSSQLTSSAQALDGVAHPIGTGQLLLLTEDSAGTRATRLRVEGSSLVAADVPLRQPRRQASSVRLDDGRVVVLGGLDAAGAPALDVEFFTP